MIAIISVQLYMNYKTYHQTLKANVNEYVDETSSLMWIWNEDDEQRGRELLNKFCDIDTVRRSY